MQKRAWNKALRTDAIAAIVVVIALLSTLIVSIAILSRRDRKSTDQTVEPRFSSSVEKTLDSTLAKVMKDGSVPGAIVGIWVPGEGTWVQARGVADISNSEPMKTDDHVRIASVTKSFVATVVLQLVDSGKLSLDDTLDKFVPRVPGSGEITVRMLLNHTSGLFDFINDNVFRAACAADPLGHWEPDEMLSSSVLHEPYFPPGAGYHYSNTNYILLGMIVEKVTGRSIESEVTRRILKPLSLSETSFPRRHEIPAPSSKGYSEKYGSLTEVSDVDPSMGWASSGMISDLADLRRWAEALANGGFISEAAERERMTFTSTDIPGEQYGLGIMKWGEFLGHEGNAFGFSTSMFYLPSRKATIVVILNLPSDRMTAVGAFLRFANVLFAGQAPAPR